jgi:protein-tyrosine phosphatase
VAYADGTRLLAATAHQNPRWPKATNENIRAATHALRAELAAAGLPIQVVPNAEVMVRSDLTTAWTHGEFLSMGDRGQYLLIEMPNELCVELIHLVKDLVQAGIRPVLAHPEREPELLHESGRIEELIRAGCLVQVSAQHVTQPRTKEDARALRQWFRRQMVHLVASDGHSPDKRPPLLAAAYQQIHRWVGSAYADRTCSTNGFALLQGLPVRVPTPLPRRAAWLQRIW